MGADVGRGDDTDALDVSVEQVVDYAIISLDPQGVIRSWNAGAQQLKGYTAGEAIGEHSSMFYPAEDREAGLPDQLLERARADGHVTYTGWRVRKDGSQFWGDVVISAVHDDRGRLSGFGKVTRDRSDAKRVEELRDALYRGITHDLRTPISAIGGFATLVRDAQPEELADLSHRILENTRTLSTLVDQLLEYVRLRTGNVQLDVAPADVRGAIEDTVAQLGPVLADHEVTIAGAEAKAAADPGALRRILTNLLANAAQYSPAGTSVTATIIEHEDTVEVTISDEGRGIAREDIRSIFDEFERGQLRRDRKGIGLGLSIVRHLVHLQDGRVWLDSEPGVGTTVGFELPRQRS